MNTDLNYEKNVPHSPNNQIFYPFILHRLMQLNIWDLKQNQINSEKPIFPH